MLVPFFQSDDDFQSNFILTTEDSREYGLITNKFIKQFERLSWSVVDIFGHVVCDHNGRKLLQVDHFNTTEDLTVIENPFEDDFDNSYPELEHNHQ